MDVNQTLRESNMEFHKSPFFDPYFSDCISMIFLRFLDVLYQSFVRMPLSLLLDTI